MVLVVVCSMLAVGVAGAWHLRSRLSAMTTVDLAAVLDAAPGAGAPVNVLVVGSDSRAGADPSSPDFGSMGDEGAVSGSRSDTLMVLRLTPGAPAALLSLPRDLWVPIAGTDRSQRINTAYGKGRDVLVRTVREAFGIPLHHYVEVDFQGFKQLVDAVGGVRVWFDVPVRDANTGLAVEVPGCHRLDGVQALAFARSRYLEWFDGERWRTDGTADLGRIGRQQYLVRVTLDQTVETASRRPWAVPGVLEAGTTAATVDTGLSGNGLVGFARRLRGADPAAMAAYTVVADPRTIGGNAVLVPDLAASGAVLDLFRGVPQGAVGRSWSRAVAQPAPEPPVGLVPSRTC